jgi:hypothetical protein
MPELLFLNYFLCFFSWSWRTILAKGWRNYGLQLAIATDNTPAAAAAAAPT